MRSWDYSTGWSADGTPNVGLVATRQAVQTLTADNQVVTVGSSSYIPLSSDNATAANRTMVLGQGAYAGQILVLEWTHATNQGELADDGSVSGGGNVRLSATWSPGQYDTLTLIWNGTDWLELCRSNN